MVEAIFAPFKRRFSSIATARAAPSTGSVPAPSSSISTRLSLSAVFKISEIFVMCEENVESDCSMLCSSPISASTFLNTEILLLSETGSISPHSAISVSRPIVFIETVLPPVLAPVITRESKSVPSDMSTGTTVFGSIKGCRAFLRSISPPELSSGRLAFILYAR